MARMEASAACVVRPLAEQIGSGGVKRVITGQV
jgi:hypothetical protein